MTERVSEPTWSGFVLWVLAGAGLALATISFSVLILVGVALVLFLIITNPAQAAASVQNIGSILYNAAQSVATFFTNLF